MKLLHQAGILLLLLPFYNPDLNPIEEAFNYVKSYLKKHNILLQSGAPLPTIVEAAFESITINHCNSLTLGTLRNSNYCKYAYSVFQHKLSDQQ